VTPRRGADERLAVDLNGSLEGRFGQHWNPVADPAVGDPATAIPSQKFVFYFSSVETKKVVLVPRVCFKNRFLIVIAAPSTNRHPLTTFLDPPLLKSIEKLSANLAL
jgi:hypothetical protein